MLEFYNGACDQDSEDGCAHSSVLTSHQARLINTATHILNDPHPAPNELVFMARELVQITLPHSDPGDIPIWTRRNGSQILSVRPGVLRGQVMAIPMEPFPAYCYSGLRLKCSKSVRKEFILATV